MREDVMREGGTLPPGWVWTTIGEITQPIEKVDPTQETRRRIHLSRYRLNRQQHPAHYRSETLSEAPMHRHGRANGSRLATFYSQPSEHISRTLPRYPQSTMNRSHRLDSPYSEAYNGVLSQYLFYYCLTDNLLSALVELQRGTSYPAVRDGDVRAQRISLLPSPRTAPHLLAVRSRNSSPGSTMLSRIKRVQANLKRYRVSVLKAACEGRLAPQAPADEPADRRGVILAERDEGGGGASGKQTSSRPCWIRMYSPELPVGWCWATVQQLVLSEPNSITDGPFGSNLKTEHYTYLSGPRVIRLQNLSGEPRISYDEQAHPSANNTLSVTKT